MKGLQPFIASCFAYRDFFDSLKAAHRAAFFAWTYQATVPVTVSVLTPGVVLHSPVAAFWV